VHFSPSKESSRQLPSTSSQDVGSGVLVGGMGVSVGEMGVLVGGTGVAVGGTGVADGTVGEAGGATHLTRSNKISVEPITHCSNFW
jgi:hypothetical protein